MAKQVIITSSPEQLHSINNHRGKQIFSLLKDYQKEFLKESMKFKKFACALRIGGGKTFCAIAWLNALFFFKKLNNVIVFAPASKLADWQNDLSGKLGDKANCFLPFRVYTLKNVFEIRKLANPDYKNYVFLASASLLAQSKLTDILRDASFTNFLKDVGFVFDESSNLRNSISKTSKNLVHFNYYCNYGLLLSGSVLSNGYEDTFVQGFLLDIDFSLENRVPKANNETITAYFSRFYHLQNIFKNTYIDTKKQENTLVKNGRTRTYSFEKIVGYLHVEELIKKLQAKMFMGNEVLPEIAQPDGTIKTIHKNFNAFESVVFIPYNSKFVPQASFRFDLKAFLNKNQVEDKGIFGFKLARDWCNGYMHFTPAIIENSGSKAKTLPEYVYNTTNKPSILKQYLTSNSTPNIIIFYAFNEELKQIETVGKELGYNVFYINGENKYSGFEIASKMMIIVHYKSGSAGLNLQNYANHLLFYSPSVSYDYYNQAKGRIARIGQTKDCFITNFVTENSLEERIFETLKMRKSFVDRTFSLENDNYEENSNKQDGSSSGSAIVPKWQDANRNNVYIEEVVYEDNEVWRKNN